MRTKKLEFIPKADMVVAAAKRSRDASPASGLAYLILVGKRRSLLNYLNKSNPGGYLELIKKLGIRKQGNAVDIPRFAGVLFCLCLAIVSSHAYTEGV